MSQKKPLLPCLGARGLNLVQNHEENIYRRFFKARLRPPIFIEPLVGLNVNDGEKVIGKVSVISIITYQIM
jgi:hypothetical protein